MVTVAGFTKSVAFQIVHKHRVRRELPVIANQYRMTAVEQGFMPEQAAVQPYAVLTDGADFLLQHQQREALHVHARPPTFLEHLSGRPAA